MKKMAKLVVISDTYGCPKKNIKKYELTQVICQSSFFLKL